MTLVELMELADRGSNPDSPLKWLYNGNTGMPLAKPKQGDTLALFIVRELADTFDSDADDDTQIDTAINALEMAKRDLDQVITAFKGHQNGLSKKGKANVRAIFH